MDSDTLSAILFFSLFGLTIVILVLGISVQTRLAQRETVPTAWQPGPLLITLPLLFVAFLAVTLPPVAALPALLFFFQGARLLRLGPGLPREGGVVVLLVGLAWAILTAAEVTLLAWSRTVIAPIRVDILLTVPAMGVLSYIGWRIPWVTARCGFSG